MLFSSFFRPTTREFMLVFPDIKLLALLYLTAAVEQILSALFDVLFVSA